MTDVMEETTAEVARLSRVSVLCGGAQVDVLARSAYERYREAHGLEPQIVEGLYPGDYLIPVGEALKARYGDSLLDKPESEWLPTARDAALAAMMDMIRDDLAALDRQGGLDPLLAQ